MSMPLILKFNEQIHKTVDSYATYKPRSFSYPQKMRSFLTSEFFFVEKKIEEFFRTSTSTQLSSGPRQA